MLAWRIGLCLFHAGYLPSLKSQHPYIPSVILFCEWQQLPLSEEMDWLQQGIQAGKKNKLEGGGSPTFEQLHPLHSVQFTLLSFPAGQSSQEQFHAVKRQSSDFQSGHLYFHVALEVSVTRGDEEGWPAVGSESSSRSRSWSSIRYRRAGPAGSGHSWQGGAGPRTLCSGPQRDSQKC